MRDGEETLEVFSNLAVQTECTFPNFVCRDKLRGFRGSVFALMQVLLNCIYPSHMLFNHDCKFELMRLAVFIGDILHFL